MFCTILRFHLVLCLHVYLSGICIEFYGCVCWLSDSSNTVHLHVLNAGNDVWVSINAFYFAAVCYIAICINRATSNSYINFPALYIGMRTRLVDPKVKQIMIKSLLENQGDPIIARCNNPLSIQALYKAHDATG